MKNPKFAAASLLLSASAVACMGIARLAHAQSGSSTAPCDCFQNLKGDVCPSYDVYTTASGGACGTFCYHHDGGAPC